MGGERPIIYLKITLINLTPTPDTLCNISLESERVYFSSLGPYLFFLGPFRSYEMYSITNIVKTLLTNVRRRGLTQESKKVSDRCTVLCLEY